MRTQTHSKSSLFLIELLFSLLFFSMIAALCIQVFVQSHRLSQKSENLNESQNLASSLAEVIIASEGNSSSMRTYFPEAVFSEDQIFLSYDSDWNLTSEENSSQEISREKEPEQKEKPSFLWIGLFVAGVGVICFCFLVYRKRKR